MVNKRRTWGVMVMVALFLAGLAWPVCAGETGGKKEKVAGVNGVVITRAEFDREMNRAKQVYGMGRPIDPSQLPEMKKKVLENLIEREVLFQESQKKGIKIEEAVVNQELEKLKKRFASEDEFKENLTRMDLTEAVLKSEFGRVMAVQRLIEEEIVVKTEVSDKEVEMYYSSNPSQFKQPEQVKASHILIGVDSGADKTKKEEARKKIDQIAARLKKDEDFAALAKEFSTCPSSAKGGDLGFFRRGQMVKPFEEAAFSLKPGEVSDIVETRFGFHIIKVIEKKPETTLTLEDVREELEQQLKQQKVRRDMGKYVAELKAKAKVERSLSENK